MERADSSRPTVRVAVTGNVLRTLGLTPAQGFDGLDAAAELLVLRAFVEDLEHGIATTLAEDVGADLELTVDRDLDHLGVPAVFPQALAGTLGDVDWEDVTFTWQSLLYELRVGRDFTLLPRTNEAIEAALAAPMVVDDVARTAV